MRHLDESLLLAIRDGVPVDDEARAHLAGCASCTVALDRLRQRADAIEQALCALDKPVEPTAAKAGVRARLTQARPPRPRWGGWHLGRAAALLLFTTGAAAALPGSPLRSLLRLPAGVIGGAPETASEARTRAAPVPSSERARAGIAVGIPDGLVEVIVRGADPGTGVFVEWSDLGSARVTAPAGSRFTYAAGRVEVDASRGDLRVELPRDAQEVSLAVDGRVYLTGSAQALEVPGPLVEQDGDALRFQVAGP